MRKLIDIGDVGDEKAELGQRWLRIAVCGPSGGGKTYSALRMATGMARVTGGPIRVIDTQNGQSLDNAEKFAFNIVRFPPPFTPGRFLATMHRSVEAGSCVLIVDSMSDEHEGYGGVGDMQEEALDRIYDAACARAEKNGWKQPDPEKYGQLAWKEAKRARRELVLGLPFVNAHIIFLFRAKKQSAAFAEKPRPGSQRGPETEDGWKPIAGDKMFWDMPLRIMLLPMANGVPTWNPIAESEKTFIRRPTQFDGVLRHFEGKPLCEEMGEAFAAWAAGNARTGKPDGAVTPTTASDKWAGKKPAEVGALLEDAIKLEQTHVGLDRIEADVNAYPKFRDETRKRMRLQLEARRASLADSA